MSHYFEKILLLLLFSHLFQNFCSTTISDDCPVKPEDLLQYITGSSSIPAVGFATKIKVEFVHGCSQNCKCKLTASTCDLTVRLTIHIVSVEQMKAYFSDAIGMSQGFGKI